MEFHMFGIKKEIRKAIKKDIGEKVDVVIQQDLEPRVVEVPEDFQSELNKNKIAKGIFENFAYTHRKEYVGWIEEAKKEEIRIRKIRKTVELISKGKKNS